MQGKNTCTPPRYNVLAEVFEFKSAKKIQKRYGFKNYYTQEQIDEALAHPAIIHFTGFLYGKPMSTKCTHPYSEYFWEQIKQCPWQVKLTDKEISPRKKFRRWALHHLPFKIYLIIESIFDTRRKYLLNKEK